MTKIIHTVTNPATGSTEGEVELLDEAQIMRAIDRSHLRFQEWSQSSPFERAEILLRAAEIMHERKERLAEQLTREQGKPLPEARAEIEYGASYFRWFGEEARRINGEILAPHTAKRKLLIERAAVGVCAAITPWNFPNAMMARKAAPALAAGCTILCRPSLATPLSALGIQECLTAAGLPADALQVICCNPHDFSRCIMDRSEVRKISFTGSTEVGKELMSQAAQTVKRVTLELGGNAPFLVFADADLERALEGLMFAKFRASGQTCVCVNRILVEESVAPRFTAMVAARLRQLKVGNGLEPDVDIGPLISIEAKARVEELLRDAENNGATVAASVPAPATGKFIAPTLLTNVKPEMRIWREEIFGPIATLATFKTEAEAIGLANGSQYGLAAYFYTRDAARLFRVYNALQFGIIGANEARISAAHIPFGGVKESGFGREGGHEGLAEYLSTKYIAVGL